MVKKLEINDIVNFAGYIDRYKIPEIQCSSQILLLLLWDNKDEEGVYTAKLFEYLVALRPILAIGGPKNSVVKNLLDYTNSGKYMQDTLEIERELLNYYILYKKDGKINYLGNTSRIQEYSHSNMAKSFSVILDGITTHRQ